MNASVNPSICIGCTLCTQICPGVFKMQADTAVAYRNPVPQDAHDCARQAAEECPVQAISLGP